MTKKISNGNANYGSKNIFFAVVIGYDKNGNKVSCNKDSRNTVVKFQAIPLKVSTNTNLATELGVYDTAQYCETYKSAVEIADYWNKSYKSNGTYFDDFGGNIGESRSFRGRRMLNESKLLDAIRKYDSDKLDSIEALVHSEYSLTLDGLIALYRHFYRTDIDFFTEFLEYTGDRRNEWLKDEYEWWDFIKTYVAYKLLDDISVNEIVQAVIDEEYVNYISDPDDIFEEFNRNEIGKWAEGICAELGIQAPDMED